MKLSNRTDFVAPKPWRDNGVDIDNGGKLVTVQEALKAGGLDWDVRLDDLYRCTHDGDYEISRYSRSVVRNDIDIELATVGMEYHPLQNNEAFSILDDIVGGREVMVSTVGYFGEGQHSWMMLQLPDYIEIPDTDVRFEKKLFAANAHTGKQSFTIGFTAVNVVCWNSYLAALRGLQNRVSIRHTSTVQVNIAQVRDTLDIASKYFDSLSEDLIGLSSVQFNQANVDEVVAKLIPFTIENDQEVLNDYNKRQRTRLSELFDEGMGNNIPGIAGTALAALNAVTQYIDHERGSVKQENRFKSAIIGQGAQFKSRAYDTIKEYALNLA